METNNQQNIALKGRKNMAQSLVQKYMHIVFSTKNREPFITDLVQDDLYAYLSGICNNLLCTPIKIGGRPDHVHILCMLSKKIALVKLLEELKSHSSKWVKLRGPQFKDFYWQEGYGAFLVNPAEIETVIHYIANQKDHHSKKTFQDEYRAFLKKYKVEYDERYVCE